MLTLFAFTFLGHVGHITNIIPTLCNYAVDMKIIAYVCLSSNVVNVIVHQDKII